MTDNPEAIIALAALIVTVMITIGGWAVRSNEKAHAAMWEHMDHQFERGSDRMHHIEDDVAEIKADVRVLLERTSKEGDTT